MVLEDKTWIDLWAKFDIRDILPPLLESLQGRHPAEQALNLLLGNCQMVIIVSR